LEILSSIEFYSVIRSNRSEQDAMFREVEPFRSILKALDLYGFDYAKLSTRHRFWSILVFLCVCPYWTVVTGSLLQFKDINDFMERLLYLPAILGIVLKALNMFLKFDHFKLLMKGLDKIYDDKKFKKYLEKASQRSMTLSKIQFFSMTASCAIASFLPYVLVPMYQISIAGCEKEIFWFYKILQTYSSLYNSYLMLSVDLMTTGIMMVISEYFNYLNDEIRSFEFNDKASMAKSEFIKCIQMHRQQKELVVNFLKRIFMELYFL